MTEMPVPEAATALEKEIVRMKEEIERLTRERNVALREGRRAEGQRAHVSALEAEVRHLEALARYVKTVSPAAGRELATRQIMAAEHFRRLRTAGDVRALERWVSEELAPLVNKSEQAAHLIATSVRAKGKGTPTAFTWPVAVDTAIRQHRNRTAQEHPQETP